MNRSLEHFLTTHTGSLPRPAALTQLYVRRLRGEAIDPAEIEMAGRAAVRAVVAKQVDQYKAEKKLLEERVRVIQTILASQSIPVHLMQALNDELPDEMWLNSISMTGNKLVLRGYSFTDFGIANFMTRLGKAGPLIREVELVVSEQAEVQKVPMKKFEVVCTVAG